MADDATRLAEITAMLPGGGENRPGQIEMAAAVSLAMSKGHHLVVQAGTGTGKSLAYLVPALRSGRRTVVATATKALQDQLADKDIPFLGEHLEEPFQMAVLKGRNNYLCRQRLEEMDTLGDQLSMDTDDATTKSGAEVLKLRAWADRTATGDRAELDFEPSVAAWNAVSVGPAECPGAQNCPKGHVCFAEDARAAAREADLVVVNTHLYGLDLMGSGALLPDHEVVVFDEAHQLEDVISAAAGLTISGSRFRNLARTGRALMTDPSLLDRLEEVGSRLDDDLAGLVGRRLEDGPTGSLASTLELAQARLEELATAMRSDTADDPRSPARLRLRTSTESLLEETRVLLGLDDSFVAWVEGPAASAQLKVAPIDVGQLLDRLLWDQHTCVLTSATIPGNTTERLGMPTDTTEVLDVGSPFDHEHQALLYCAAHMPDPRSEEFLDAVAEELVELIEAAGGRTLGLFTSWRALDHVAPIVADRVDVPILTQADLPKAALIEQFTRVPESCLMATMSFWQGVDVPGATLSLVTIDKIPFPRPDEPLLQARRERAGRGAFRTIDLPRAAMLLAQGAGRLIRSSGDRGVVAVFDPRLASAGYAWDLINALPPMSRTKSKERAIEALAQIAAGESLTG